MKTRNFVNKYNLPHDTQTMRKISAETIDNIKITEEEIEFLTIRIFFCPLLKFNRPSNLNYVTFNNDQVAIIQVFFRRCVVVQDSVITEFAALIHGYVFSRGLCHFNGYQHSSDTELAQIQNTTSVNKNLFML